MKKSALTILLFLNIVPGFSQSLVTTNKLWSNLKMDYWNPTNLSTEYLKFTTDTMINGQIYNKVERSLDENQQNWSGYGFIREDGAKRIYFRLSGTEPEYLFYDFNLQLYDTITAYSINTLDDNLFIQPQVYFVVSVDNILIGETFRKQINLGVVDDSVYSFEHWIDSTGNTGGLLHNLEMLVGRDSYSLLCFSEDGIVKYHHPDIDSCFVLTGLDDKYSFDVHVRIVPDPVIESSTLFVEHPDGHIEMHIDLFDFTGRTICSENFFDKLQLLKNDFKPGIYFYQIAYGYGKVLNGKFIVD